MQRSARPAKMIEFTSSYDEIAPTAMTATHVFAADLVAYPLGRGRLVTAPIRGPFVGDNLTGGHVDAGHAVLGERPRDLHQGVGVDAAAVPVGRRDPGT